MDAARIQSQEKQTTVKVLADAAKEDEILKVKQAIEGAKLGIGLHQNTSNDLNNNQPPIEEE